MSIDLKDYKKLQKLVAGMEKATAEGRPYEDLGTLSKQLKKTRKDIGELVEVLREKVRNAVVVFEGQKAGGKHESSGHHGKKSRHRLVSSGLVAGTSGNTAVSSTLSLFSTEEILTQVLAIEDSIGSKKTFIVNPDNSTADQIMVLPKEPALLYYNTGVNGGDSAAPAKMYDFKYTTAPTGNVASNLDHLAMRGSWLSVVTAGNNDLNSAGTTPLVQTGYVKPHGFVMDQYLRNINRLQVTNAQATALANPERYEFKSKIMATLDTSGFFINEHDSAAQELGIFETETASKFGIPKYQVYRKADTSPPNPHWVSQFYKTGDGYSRMDHQQLEFAEGNGEFLSSYRGNGLTIMDPTDGINSIKTTSLSINALNFDNKADNVQDMKLTQEGLKFGLDLSTNGNYNAWLKGVNGDPELALRSDQTNDDVSAYYGVHRLGIINGAKNLIIDSNNITVSDNANSQKDSLSMSANYIRLVDNDNNNSNNYIFTLNAKPELDNGNNVISSSGAFWLVNKNASKSAAVQDATLYLSNNNTNNVNMNDPSTLAAGKYSKLNEDTFRMQTVDTNYVDLKANGSYLTIQDATDKFAKLSSADSKLQIYSEQKKYALLDAFNKKLEITDTATTDVTFTTIIDNDSISISKDSTAETNSASLSRTTGLDIHDETNDKQSTLTTAQLHIREGSNHSTLDKSGLDIINVSATSIDSSWKHEHTDATNDSSKLVVESKTGSNVVEDWGSKHWKTEVFAGGIKMQDKLTVRANNNTSAYTLVLPSNPAIDNETTDINGAAVTRGYTYDDAQDIQQGTVAVMKISKIDTTGGVTTVYMDWDDTSGIDNNFYESDSATTIAKQNYDNPGGVQPQNNLVFLPANGTSVRPVAGMFYDQTNMMLQNPWNVAYGVQKSLINTSLEYYQSETVVKEFYFERSLNGLGSVGLFDIVLDSTVLNDFVNFRIEIEAMVDNSTVETSLRPALPTLPDFFSATYIMLLTNQNIIANDVPVDKPLSFGRRVNGVASICSPNYTPPVSTYSFKVSNVNGSLDTLKLTDQVGCIQCTIGDSSLISSSSATPKKAKLNLYGNTNNSVSGRMRVTATTQSMGKISVSRS